MKVNTPVSPQQKPPRPGRIINLTGSHEPIGLNAANSGTPVASATIANKEYYNDGDGERRQVTTFLDVTVWGSIRRIDLGYPSLLRDRLSLSC